MLLEDIQLQPLQKIELLDPWPRNVSGTASRSLLAGAMILHFDHTALVCTSPLRFMRCQSGTTIAKPDGIGMASLGYRITLTKSDECSQWHPTGLCKEVIKPVQWLAGTVRDRPAVHVLLHAAWDEQHKGAWALKLRFVGGSYCLTWRPDLDGCIEFAPAGQQHTIDSIAVTSPTDAFGWLHPAYQHPFALDESCWRSAKSGRSRSAGTSCGRFAATTSDPISSQRARHSGLSRSPLARSASTWRYHERS